jgi:Zn-dependent M28 family amino/carboxypeptidase
MEQGKLIRFSVVALPVGLLILGMASMLYTQFKPDTVEFDADYHKRMDAASLNRKPINRPDLERFVRILSEEIGERHLGQPEALERAAIWIESTLKGGNLGYQVQRQVFPAEGKEPRNLIAELTGIKRSQEIMVIGAHYDTVPGCPGANSAGTGVAALLALAQAFAGDPQERTIRFVVFANGEPPFSQTTAMGSHVYAKSCASREENIVAMLSLDSLGSFSDQTGNQGSKAFPEIGNFVAFLGDDNAQIRVISAKNAFMRASGFPTESGSLTDLHSDQWSFAKAGYPAVLVTDLARFRYPDFHLPSDRLGKIDFESLEKVCLGLKAVIESWSNL